MLTNKILYVMGYNRIYVSIVFNASVASPNIKKVIFPKKNKLKIFMGNERSTISVKLFSFGLFLVDTVQCCKERYVLFNAIHQISSTLHNDFNQL